MSSEEVVRRELHELRYYYSRKEQFNQLDELTGDMSFKALATKYNNAIRGASAKLYDLYGCLYLQNKTQEAVASELCYSMEHIRRLMRELMRYFCQRIET